MASGDWKIVERPGPTYGRGKEFREDWDSKYGKGVWRKAWSYNGLWVGKPDVFYICEFAYRQHAKHNLELWERLGREASNVFDKNPEEVSSGTDYEKQLSGYTRFHDIAVRRVMELLGIEFEGDELLQIRWKRGSENWQDHAFDPFKVKFHDKNAIIKPHLQGPWDDSSIEQFYQDNKAIIVPL